MIDYIKAIMRSYERLIATKLVLLLWAYGGALVVFLVLSILLIMQYPHYAWCIFGGIAALWIIIMLTIFIYQKIIRANHEVELHKSNTFNSITTLLGVAAATSSNYLKKTPQRKNTKK